VKVLLVEDEDPKLAGLVKFLRDFEIPLSITVARSVKSALAELRTTSPDMLVLDMSLPTFDISLNEPGGRPQGFGGLEIVRYLDSVDSYTPTIVVSAYEAFSRSGQNIELKTLATELMRDYPQIISGVVYFNPMQGRWSEELTSLIESCISTRLGSGK
jgi:CheY-like chemotaxis protein